MGAPPQGTRVEGAASDDAGSESWAAYDTEHTWQVIDALLAVADTTGRSPAQVALRWLLQRPGVTAPIIGARTMAHLEDNLGATGWSLTEDQLADLTTASRVRAPYPYELLRRFRRRPA